MMDSVRNKNKTPALQLHSMAEIKTYNNLPTYLRIPTLALPDPSFLDAHQKRVNKRSGNEKLNKTCTRSRYLRRWKQRSLAGFT